MEEEYYILQNEAKNTDDGVAYQQAMEMRKYREERQPQKVMRQKRIQVHQALASLIDNGVTGGTLQGFETSLKSLAASIIPGGGGEKVAEWMGLAEAKNWKKLTKELTAHQLLIAGRAVTDTDRDFVQETRVLETDDPATARKRMEYLQGVDAVDSFLEDTFDFVQATSGNSNVGSIQGMIKRQILQGKDSIPSMGLRPNPDAPEGYSTWTFKTFIENARNDKLANRGTSVFTLKERQLLVKQWNDRYAYTSKRRLKYVKAHAEAMKNNRGQ